MCVCVEMILVKEVHEETTVSYQFFVAIEFLNQSITLANHILIVHSEMQKNAQSSGMWCSRCFHIMVFSKCKSLHIVLCKPHREKYSSSTVDTTDL